MSNLVYVMFNTNAELGFDYFSKTKPENFYFQGEKILLIDEKR